MSISSQISADGKVVSITVSDRFDFSLHREFRETYRHTPGPSTEYLVDLGRTEYMDSSALGMLLLLREHAGGDGARVVIKRVSPEIRKILSIANFGKLFSLE